MEGKEMIARASAYVDEHRDEMLKLWERLVSTESGNGDKEGVDKVCEMLRAELNASNTATEIVPMEKSGNLLKGVFHGERAEAPILLIGHMDTVFAKGTLAKNPFRIDEEGKAHGPGILDMKAGLVIAVYVLRALDACGYGKRPVKLVFAGDEENGHRLSTAEEEIRKICAGCAAAFNFETGFLDDGLVVGRKGSCRVTLNTTGVASHAGNDPERGRSAILEMAHKIIEIQKLHDFEHGLFVNVGVIQGGTVPNAVPGNCEIQIDIRYESRERLEQTLKKIREIADTSVVPDTKTSFSMTKPSEVMEASEKNLELFEHVKKAADLIGYGAVKTKKVGGWSDSCLAAACGVPVVCAMGVKGANNHSMEEYAVAETLFERAKLALVIAMIISWLVFGTRGRMENFGASFCNVGFIGIPLVQAALGESAVFYLASFIALLNILQWTYGVLIMTGNQDAIRIKTIVSNPVVLSFFLGILLFFLQVPVPPVLVSTLSSIGSMNTPLAMIILGTYLAKMNWKEIFTTKSAYLCVLLRLIVIPAATLFVLCLIPGVNVVIKQVVLIACCTPVGSNIAIFAKQYDADYKLSVVVVCLSTILCIVTVPVFYMFVERFLLQM